MSLEKLKIEQIAVRNVKGTLTYFNYSVNSIPRGEISVSNHAPLGDCQTFCIANIIKILLLPQNQALGVLKKLQNLHSKKQLLFNINEEYCSYADKIFKDNIIVKEEYRSTRGSDMIMYIVNLYKTVLYCKIVDDTTYDSVLINPQTGEPYTTKTEVNLSF